MCGWLPARHVKGSLEARRVSKKNAKQREYKVYGHDRGSHSTPRYLFTVEARRAGDAEVIARHRVKGAKVIDKVERKSGRTRKRFQYGICPFCGKKGAYVEKRTYNPDYTFIKCKYCGKGSVFS